MAFIDGTVVNVALPADTGAAGATAIDAQWIVESYALFLAALILVGGSLGDHYGRRRIFTLGVVIFAAASVWCGLASSPEQLIVARAVQGVGGALLVPGSLAIISASFEEERRGRAIGTWSGFSGITAAIGPVLGGYLVENVSWRAAFFINVPLAVVVLWISFRHVPESRDPDARRLDIPGAVLATLGLGGVVYGLIESQHRRFHRPVGARLARARRRRARRLRIRRGARRGADDATLAVPLAQLRGGQHTDAVPVCGAGRVTVLPALPPHQVHGYSATAAGSAFLPFVLITFVLSRWAGGLVVRYGAGCRS